ncbi:MAG: response regulator [Methanoregula sp.]|jgi:DNA-binding NarL/FixJ family response regulator|uniref:response regulator n=1 Tax=Methanoregula sp. TaxID=2052170 RepID=UPI003C1D01A6
MTKILLVEDDDIVARVATWRLEKLGYEVCGRATNSADALKLAGEHHPDLVLMDINIVGPDDGITTAKMLKEVTDARIVYLTSQSDDETIIRAAETQPAGYIAKPFEDKDLKIGIEIALRKK